jgi:hypothetical protein
MNDTVTDPWTTAGTLTIGSGASTNAAWFGNFTNEVGETEL